MRQSSSTASPLRLESLEAAVELMASPSLAFPLADRLRRMRRLALSSCECLNITNTREFAEFVDSSSLISPLASYISGHTLEVTGGSGI